MSAHIHATALRTGGVRTPLALREALQHGAKPAAMTAGPRPPRIPAGSWRRMSRLSRCVTEVALEAIEGFDTRELQVVWGTAFGELETTSAFLTRLFLEGPGRASPMAFQTSVFGTPVSHLSIALGLRGASETISAGTITSSMALMRGIDLLNSGAPGVLVLCGDTLDDTVRTAAQLAGQSHLLGEAVSAVLLSPAGSATVEVCQGGIPDHQYAEQLGSCPTLGLALIAGGLDTICETDGEASWTMRVTR